MEELYEILEDIIPGEDYKNSTALVDDDILTSFELVRLVTEIDSTFDISIPPARSFTILIQRKPFGR
ncbi:MAG: acyl carrier protein [Enterocloster sp.]